MRITGIHYCPIETDDGIQVGVETTLVDRLESEREELSLISERLRTTEQIDNTDPDTLRFIAERLLETADEMDAELEKSR